VTAIRTLAASIRDRRVSSHELVSESLRRIEALDPELGAVVALRPQALEEARVLDGLIADGEDPGPLAGLPLLVKDVTEVAGMRTTFGSLAMVDAPPADRDAVAVARLRGAGAVVVGKTNTPEFAAGGNTFNAIFGATRNPWNPALTCGGSSGGSAVALATGMAALATGTDLGGSLRTPSAFCGVVGFRTSPGLIPYWPRELAWDTLTVTGPMARTVGDVALMLAAVAGPDDRSPISYAVDGREFLRAVKRPSVKGWRAAWTPDLNGLIPVEGEVERVAAEALAVFRGLGVRVVADCCDFSETNEIVMATRGVEKVALHADKLPKWRDQMQKGLVWNIEQGLTLTPRAIGRGETLRTQLWHRVRAFMERYDLLLLPTVTVLPFPVEQAYPTEINGKPLEHYIQWAHLTYAISLTGLPAISVPCGVTRSGLPVGLQIVGRRRQEAAVLRAAAAFEAAAPWAGRIPPTARPAGA
jgi:amidase